MPSKQAVDLKLFHSFFNRLEAKLSNKQNELENVCFRLLVDGVDTMN